MTAELLELVASWRARGAREYTIEQRLSAAVLDLEYRREALKLDGRRHVKRQKRRAGR